jgi:hypothetical protein
MKRADPILAVMVTLAAIVVAGCAHASVAVKRAQPDVGAMAWEQLKRALPGSWQMEGKSGPFVVSYKLVSGGSALVESWGAGGPHETVTVFHPDHAELLLVHYCAQGNQPRLRAVEAGVGTVSFRFLDATNVLPGQAMLVERRLRLSAGGDELEDTEVYRQPQGSDETTVYRFRRASSSP